MQLYTQQYFMFLFKKHVRNPADVVLIHFIMELFIF